MNVAHLSDREKAGDEVRELGGANTWQLLVSSSSSSSSSSSTTVPLDLSLVASFLGGPGKEQGTPGDSVSLARNNQL